METIKGKSATKAKNKYNAQNYDNLRIVVPKGRKAELKNVAEAAGESLNSYVAKSIDERIIRNRPSFAKAYTIIGGVNGTGKSSFSGVMKSLMSDLGIGVIIDVDKITALNKVFPIEGSKIAIKLIEELLEDGESFAQETTLAGQKTKNTAREAKEKGYFVRLYYIGLNTPEESLKRISNRVARGGHDIGEVDVRRRFEERWKAVKRVLPYCDEAIFFDNDNGFVEVAEYTDGKLVLKGDRHPEWVPELAACLKKN